jgi:hypothetical protein
MELLVHLGEHGLALFSSGRYDPDGLRHNLEVTAIYYSAGAIATIILTVSGWIYAARLRRRIKNDLGETAGAVELTSLETWMKVDEAEQKLHPGQAWAPDAYLSDDTPSKRDL